MEKVKKAAKEITEKVTEIGKKAATTAFNGLKKLAGISFKTLSVGIGAAATAVGALVTKSVQAFADFEQLKGGVETLFKGSAGVVQKYANDAYKTAGLSANEYMETVTSFSASLIASCGGDTAKAAEYANVAISDMSDNANKMGTDMGLIQNAYQGFAKQNYTMLDNLKLGYGGTKEEMKRLVADAAKLDKSIDANSLSYGNIVKAIHAVQVKMDIYGTTQKEAEKTITGSFNSMQSAWGNLLPALIQGGDSFNQCVDNLVYSVGKFAENIKPAILKALSGVGDLIDKLAPMIEENIPTLVDELLPPLIKAAVALAAGIIKALPSIVKTIAKEIPDIAKTLWQTIVDTFGEQLPILNKIGEAFTGIGLSFKKFGDFLSKHSDTIVTFIPILLGLVGAFKAFKAISAIGSLFGGKSGGGDKGGLLGGITNIFKSLAKAKPVTILKGMGNLAIILGGFTILAAAFSAVAPHIAKLSDLKSIGKVVAVIAILGVLGTALSKFGEIVGKIPIMTVVKGLANMAIMLTGMTALSAAFVAVAPYIAKLTDFKAIGKVVAVIGILGVLGTALSILAGIVGVIPIPIVLTGLANIAIVLAGFTALAAAFAAVTPHIAPLIDGGAIIKVSAIMLTLGGLGTVLTVFAGIAGIIPIPVVLAGLANIALVVNGMTALIAEYALLSKIDGFNEFIQSGGDTLALVFEQIGKIGGSLIGGFGEAMSESLPKIGENLAQFGENIKPLFEAIRGVDMGGVGAFFTSLVGLLGIATGNELIEGIKAFFGGDEESSLSKLGTQLSDFAGNSKEFFNIVAELPDDGFSKATSLFDCLAGLKSLPKEGGVVGWFTGNINYENLANGLSQLSSEKVTGFFTAVSELKQAGFDNATALFDCLAGMKSLPKDGGVVGWFAGDVNYANIASGLGDLAGEGVKNFFAMVSGFEQKTFDNTTALFECLGGIKSLPTDGGFWSDLGNAITGNDDTRSNLAIIADDLGYFAENVDSFFDQVNSLSLENLNGLWSSLKKAGELTTTNLSSVIDKSISDLVSKISTLPKKMGDAMKKNSKALSDGFVEMWKAAVKASVAPVNKLLGGANHILKEFGSKKKLISWEPYAKGTDGHKGGNALVNDGRGAELVQMPNGNAFIPKGRNVFIPNAPKGMKVLPADQTAQLMGKKSSTFRYANGIGEIDIWSFIDNASGLVSKISESVSYDGLSGFRLNLGKAMVSTLSGEMSAWIEKLFEEEGAMSLSSYVASKGVSQWKSTVIRALKMEGQYSAANVARTLYQMQTESGGNPRAINLWDSNAKKGIPSKGLMQVIDPTFRAYARSGFDKNIYDPLSNILASVRYAVSRYGSLAKAYRGVGYANGGIATKPSIFGEDGAEMAIPLSASKRNRAVGLWAQTGKILGLPSYAPEQNGNHYETNSVENITYAPQFTLNINGTSDDRATARKVKRWVQEAIDETFESIERKNPRLQEV